MNFKVSNKGKIFKNVYDKSIGLIFGLISNTIDLSWDILKYGSRTIVLVTLVYLSVTIFNYDISLPSMPFSSRKKKDHPLAVIFDDQFPRIREAKDFVDDLDVSDIISEGHSWLKTWNKLKKIKGYIFHPVSAVLGFFFNSKSKDGTGDKFVDNVERELNMYDEDIEFDLDSDILDDFK